MWAFNVKLTDGIEAFLWYFRVTQKIGKDFLSHGKNDSNCRFAPFSPQRLKG